MLPSRNQPKEENLPAEIKKYHRLINRGSMYFCVCGMCLSNAVTRRDADLMQQVHIQAVIESIEDQRAGRSHYDEP